MSTTEQTTDEVAAGLIATARQHLVKDEFEQAIAGLATALDMLTTTYGDLAPQAAECYYLYGRALTLNISANNTLLGGDAGGGDGDDEEEGDDNDEEDNEVPQEGAAGSAASGEGEAEPSAAVAGENVDDSQLAWEVLETARIIFSKLDGAKAQEYLGKIHGTMADLSMEGGTFDVAVNEYKAALHIQELVNPPLSRVIAETHFKLALANEVKPDIDQATVHLVKAIQLLEARVQWLQITPPAAASDDKGKGKAPAEDGGNFAGVGGIVLEPLPPPEEAKVEIQEIQELLEALHQKKEDYDLEAKKEFQLNEERKNIIRAAFGELASLGGATPSASSSASSSSSAVPAPAVNAFGFAAPSAAAAAAPVNDLSSVVRKRKAPDAAPAQVPAQAPSAAVKPEEADGSASKASKTEQ